MPNHPKARALAAALALCALAACTSNAARPAEPAAPSVSASPSPSPTAGHDLAIADLSWVSADRGWAVAIDTTCVCPGVVAGTADGGVTWQILSQVPSVTHRPASVRFANADTGYLLVGDQSLLVTRDGGRHWSPLPTPPGHLFQIEVARSGATLLLNIPKAKHAEICAPCYIFHAPIGSDQWTRTLTWHTLGHAELVRSGDLVFFAGYPGNIHFRPDYATAESWRSRDGGRHWQSYPDPCENAEFDGEGKWAGGFSVAGRSVVVHCTSFTPIAKYSSFTIASGDGGDTFGRAEEDSCYGPFAIGDAGTMVCSSDYRLRVRSPDGSWQTAYEYKPLLTTKAQSAAAVLDGCGMQNPHDGRCWTGHHLLTTHDGGRSWALTRFPN